MSVAAIRTAVVAILTTAGAYNVTSEETVSLDMGKAVEDRVHGNRTHFWIVRFSRAAGEGGAGYIDRRHRVQIEGYVGLSRDEPTDGTVSDVTVATLWDALIAALENPSNAHPGGAIDFEGVTPEPIRVSTVRVGSKSVPVHALRATATYLETV